MNLFKAIGTGLTWPARKAKATVTAAIVRSMARHLGGALSALLMAQGYTEGDVAEPIAGVIVALAVAWDAVQDKRKRADK